MKKKIILVKMETEDVGQIYPPYGILYVTGALMKNGYEVEIFHEKGTQNNLEKLRSMIDDNTLFVGFSVMTGPQLIPAIKASEIVHGLAPVVWGGVHPAILPKQVLKEDFVDYAIFGEGEETSVEIANALNSGKGFRKIKGLGFKENGKIKLNKEREFIKDLDSYSIPWGRINVEKYFLKILGQKKVLPVITSRGCVHQCEFCYNAYVNKRRWRFHSVEYSVKTINYLKNNFQIDGVKFHDDNFFGNMDRAVEIIEKTGMPWFAEIRADYVTEERIKKFHENNCRVLFIGAESGSQKILNRIKKDITVKQIINTVVLCSKYDIIPDLSFMVGFPGEDEEDVKKTLSLIERIMNINPKAICTLKIYTPYPGTPLYDFALKNGFEPPSKTEEWSVFVRESCILPWVENPKKLENICEITNVAFSLKVPLFSRIARFRFRHRFFSFVIDLKFLNMLKFVRNRLRAI
jgi:radical SAM superfamily enzyme YgiQ (UPF0313 family)